MLFGTLPSALRPSERRLAMAGRRAGRLSCGETCHPYQVIGCDRHLRPHLVPFHANIAKLPPTAYRLQPAEDLLDAFPPALTLAVPWVPGCAPVDGASALSRRRELRDMQRDSPLAAGPHKSPVVVASVAGDGLAATARQPFQHLHRRLPLGYTHRLRYLHVHGQPTPVLHQ